MPSGTVDAVELLSHAGHDGIRGDSAAAVVTRNAAYFNHDLGIQAVPGATDGGGNRARHNGNPAQCAGRSPLMSRGISVLACLDEIETDGSAPPPAGAGEGDRGPQLPHLCRTFPRLGRQDLNLRLPVQPPAGRIWLTRDRVGSVERCRLS